MLDSVLQAFRVLRVFRGYSDSRPKVANLRFVHAQDGATKYSDPELSFAVGWQFKTNCFAIIANQQSSACHDWVIPSSVGQRRNGCKRLIANRICGNDRDIT